MARVLEYDLGTPEATGEPVTLTIDGRRVTVPAGTSILRAAAIAGTSIPKLCATDSLVAFGSCRVCLVEIEGRPGTPASCTTPVAPGMGVRTRSEQLERLRRVATGQRLGRAAEQFGLRSLLIHPIPRSRNMNSL